MFRGLVILLTLSACSKQSATLGALRLSGLETLSPAESSLVREIAEDFNVRAGKSVLLTEGPTATVTFHRTSAAEMAALPQNETTHDGLAVRSASGCDVYIRDTYFTNAQRDSFTALAWHEVGHCYALEHATADTEIMFPSFQPSSAYGADAIARFFGLVVSASGL